MANIVICCDGTGNEYGKNNTNVVNIFSLAKKTSSQTTFYDPGVGTGGWEYEEESGFLTAKSDLATGYGLQKNVLDAYRYLMSHYKKGDKLFLFGFSRGAFTARSLGGMLHKCGLLEPGSDNLVEYASKIYNTKGNQSIARGFRDTFSYSCPVHFIGVWDTVESLVMNAGKKFHDTTLNSEVSFGYQAISIDEKRKDFPICMWNETDSTGPFIEQVWFAGVHSDVGGWYDERGLSNIALRWMLRKAKSAGLAIDDNLVATMPGDHNDKIHESYSGFWKFRGSRTRKIPEGSLIHKSVFDRMSNAANKYKPKNLPEDYTVVD
jgi:uncharacterized protein (DUF2235 family)